MVLPREQYHSDTDTALCYCAGLSGSELLQPGALRSSERSWSDLLSKPLSFQTGPGIWTYLSAQSVSNWRPFHWHRSAELITRNGPLGRVGRGGGGACPAGRLLFYRRPWHFTGDGRWPTACRDGFRVIVDCIPPPDRVSFDSQPMDQIYERWAKCAIWERPDACFSRLVTAIALYNA